MSKTQNVVPVQGQLDLQAKKSSERYRVIRFSGSNVKALEIALNDQAANGRRYVDHVAVPGNEFILIFESSS